MNTQRNSLFIRFIACILVVILVIPYTASAASTETIAPRASDYLISYTSYICDMGGGELQIWYRVTGAGTQAELGVLSIQLFESTDQVNWTRVAAFSHNNHEGMLAYDEWQHMSYVTYQGRLCKYYRAYVCIWGGDGTNGDARYFWTDVEYASPFT